MAAFASQAEMKSRSPDNGSRLRHSCQEYPRSVHRQSRLRASLVQRSAAIPFSADRWVGRWLAAKPLLLTVARKATATLANTLKQQICQQLGALCAPLPVQHSLTMRIHGLSAACR